MHAVLATFLAMAQGSVNNVEAILPDPPGPVASAAAPTGPAPYAYDQDHCITRRSGAIVCRRHLR